MLRLSTLFDFRPRLILLGAGIALSASSGVATEWDALLNNSPFGQAPVVAAPTAGEPEFRGVVEEDGVYLINLYDPATKTGQWIPVNGKSQGLEVKSYDASTDKIEIIQAGKPLTLQLKHARVNLVAVALPAPPPPVVGGKPEDNAANAEAASGNAEDRRTQVRELIRQRMANGGPNGTATPGAPFMRNMPPEAQAMIEEFRRRRAAAAPNPQPAPAPANPAP